MPAVVCISARMSLDQGKIMFMAPTKPLVAQQIEACYHIMGIPQAHTAEMTGDIVCVDYQTSKELPTFLISKMFQVASFVYDACDICYVAV